MRPLNIAYFCGALLDESSPPRTGCGPREDCEHQGEARFDPQYWRANISPPELYVLTVPGSSKHRLPAVDSHEFTNLYLAGDWTDNGLNLGCVESAAMSGLQASVALAG